ncbi:Aminoglycoside N(6')-acetyltransferase type 1 [Fibrella aestuarina BUZ 2]|uniref:Aminoglycoside N(6')-acetyltransferase type 1 n=1 Tax=Fibrella aestuarina BUZ 2 TaxID=1166018 RepID=I0KF29_9BACT|nr:aminoglycoside 6'-N-acetyltransferase [Fibrella aestuarina]CCH02732.1 Aminoglycoside N(6')-acetyltransferase type 1 [Fibrella aestuarina BUZ 2]
MTIHEVAEKDLDDWLQLALELWPDYDAADMQAILGTIDQSPREAGFLARDERGKAIGFMNLSLRIDYVPGASQTPVAYLEGIYVQPDRQDQGIGRALISRAEQWAREQGCTELASDVLFDNQLGQAFHKRSGFTEVERVVFYIKQV